MTSLQFRYIPLCTPVGPDGACDNPQHLVGGLCRRNAEAKVSAGKRPVRGDWSSHWSLERPASGNAGVLTGPDSGILVIDVDTKEAAETYGSWCLPTTFTVRSGRGGPGRHYYFRWPDGLLRVPDRLDGVEIKGPGRQVVAWDSLHKSGGRYEKLGGQTTTLPEAFVARLRDAVAQRERVEASDATPAAEAKLAEWVDMFPEAELQPDGNWEMRCPAHNDHDPSLIVMASGNQLVLKCRTGCPAEDIVEAMGWTMSDLWTRSLAQKEAPEGLAKPAARASRFKRAIDIEEKDVEWLWDGWLPLGKVTILAGEPSAAKTFIAMRIAAAISKGEPLPGDRVRREPASVMYLSFEDGLDDTLKPRGRRMGADLHRLLLADAETAPQALDISTIDADIVAEGVKLLVIDPMDSYIGGGADTGLANKVRDALADTVSLAQRHNIAVLIIHHVNKGTGTAMHRISGSLGGFVGLVRVAWIAGQHDGQKALACGKNNLSEFPPTLGYTIEDVDGPGTRSGVAVWGDTLPEVTANDLTAVAKRDSGPEGASEQDKKELVARVWLAQRLSGAGWVATAELEREVRDSQPFGWTLVKHARAHLGVQMRNTPTVPRRTEWCWDGNVTAAFAS